MPYLLFSPATFVTENGLQVNDRQRMGVYIACAAIVVANAYILMNTYRWDWLMLLLVALSIIAIWFWTGVYTASTISGVFYQGGAEVYGSLSFWTLSLLTVMVCLLPRFTAKAFQKVFFPNDVDIVREQVSQGKFKYLDQPAHETQSGKSSSLSSSDASKANGAARSSGPPKSRTPDDEEEEDCRPIYPPSTAATHNNRSTNGSDGTDYTGHRSSLERVPPLRGMSGERPRPSFDRMHSSLDRIRPSFEVSNDFTSAAMLTRMESIHSDIPLANMARGPAGLR
jgi:phospholipid-translocating ATPase